VIYLLKCVRIEIRIILNMNSMCCLPLLPILRF